MIAQIMAEPGAAPDGNPEKAFGSRKLSSLQLIPDVSNL